MLKPARVRHDEHYHVDFGVHAASPGSGRRKYHDDRSPAPPNYGFLF